MIRDFLSSFFVKKQGNIDKRFVNSMSNNGYSFIWQNLNDCWKVVISLNTYYEIQEYNTEAQAYKNKIVNWIGKDWIYLQKENWEVLEDLKTTQKVQDIFSIPTFRLFKEQYFTHNFCSGDIYLYPQRNYLDEIQVQVVDSRIMEKEIDKKWNITAYKQRSKWGVTAISPDRIYNSIVRFNARSPYYGESLYKSIIYDAMSEKESARRSFYFFKNNAMPNVLFMLDPEIDKKNFQEIEQRINDKYKWIENSSKPMISGAIQDAKVLHVNNKDLDLINLREFLIKKMGIVFQIDPRLIWFINDAWAYNAIVEIRKEAKETLSYLSQQLEEDMNNFYRKFIDTKATFRIKIKTESFDDKTEIAKNQRNDLVLWLKTLNEIRTERGLENYKEDFANKPILQTNLQTSDKLTSEQKI